MPFFFISPGMDGRTTNKYRGYVLFPSMAETLTLPSKKEKGKRKRRRVVKKVWLPHATSFFSPIFSLKRNGRRRRRKDYCKDNVMQSVLLTMFAFTLHLLKMGKEGLCFNLCITYAIIFLFPTLKESEGGKGQCVPKEMGKLFSLSIIIGEGGRP